MYELMTRDGRNIPIEYYPDGMPRITDLNVPQELILRPRNLGDFMAAMCLLDAQAARGYPIKTLVLPFIPGARQDRLNETGDQLFTLRTVADALNARNIQKVRVLDPHSDVACALIHNVGVVTPSGILRCTMTAPTMSEYAGVISPDAGAEKRASAVAKSFGLPLFHAGKTRDVTTGAISNFWCEPLPRVPEARRLLVVDDICDGGGTFNGLADSIRAKQPFVGLLDLYVTHGLFSQGTAELTKRFKRIFTTDSILHDAPLDGVTVINVCQGWI